MLKDFDPIFIFGKPPFFLKTPPTPPETRFPVNFWGRFGYALGILKSVGYALGHLWVNFEVPPRGWVGDIDLSPISDAGYLLLPTYPINCYTLPLLPYPIP